MSVQGERDTALGELRARLRDGLARKGLTVTQAARRAELGRTTVHEALQPDGKGPTPNTVAALARALGLPHDELMELRRIAAGKVKNPPTPPPDPGPSAEQPHVPGPGPDAAAKQPRVRRPVVLAVLAVVVAGGTIAAVTLLPGQSPRRSAGRPAHVPSAASLATAVPSVSVSPADRSTSSPRTGPTGSRGGNPVPGPSAPTARPPAPVVTTGPPAQQAAPHQTFSIGDTVRLQNVSTRQCVSGGSGQSPSWGACSASEAYGWQLKPSGGSTFKVVNSASGECLSASFNQDSPAGLEACTGAGGTGRVYWRIASSTAAGQSLKNDTSGQCLAIGRPYSFYNTDQVFTTTCNPDDTSQLWEAWKTA